MIRSAVVCAASLHALVGQGLQFDVASIKPTGTVSTPDRRSYGNPSPGQYLARNTPLLLFIEQAYKIRTGQVVGGPDWIRSDGYDVAAKAEVGGQEGTSRREGTQPMFPRDRLRLQAFLQQRFELIVHRETRKLPVYEVTIAKGGPKIQPQSCVAFDEDRPAANKPGSPRPAYCGLAPYEQNGIRFRMVGSGVTMAQLFEQLSNFSELPLVDRTGYTGVFNATVEWYTNPLSAPIGPNNASASEPLGPPLATALQRQLGLKLRRRRSPTEVLVIDRVERPSAN